MVIMHNLTAMNVQRQFGININSKKKTTEKLASGYRINRAADDAAGLAISEKMRSQIRGLAKGVQNTEDGISLCQVADGALSAVCDILHRIKELSVQSANGTNTDSDRTNLQDEVSQLLEQIDAIGDDTEFNTLRIFSNMPNQNITSEISGITTTTKTELPQIDNLTIFGTPQDESVTLYEFSSSSSGILINGDLIEWKNITNASGASIEGCTNGTYSISYNGLSFTFDAANLTAPQDAAALLAGTNVNMKVHDNSKTSIVSLSSNAYIPFTSYNPTYLSEDVFLKDIHTLTADQNGVTLDGIYTVKWSDVYPPTTNNKMSLAFGEGNITGIVLDVQLNDEQSLDDIISELDGLSINTISTGHVVSDGAFAGNGQGATGTNYGIELPLYDIADNFALNFTCCDLPVGLFADQGYDVNNVYIPYNTGSGHIELDLNNVSQSYLTFSIDGSKATTFSLKQESQTLLQSIIDNGGTVTKGTEIILTFEYNGIEMPLAFCNWYSDFNIQTDLVDFINSKANDLILRKAFSEKTLDVAGIDFTNRGSAGKTYAYDITGNPNLAPDEPDNSEEPEKEKTISNGLWIQSGAREKQGLYLEIDQMNTAILNIDRINISTMKGAEEALINVKGALSKILKSRSKIGAQQNRLEHTVLWEEAAVENLTASESRIRDADIASEIVLYSKHNILEQAGHALMAQANQSTQGVLQLLSS